MIYLIDEVEISNINQISYNDFLKHEVVLYVKSNLSKKQLRNFRNKMNLNSFYPFQIIRDCENDTQEVKYQKLKNVQKFNEKLFLKRYCDIAKKQFNKSSLFDIKDYIEKCPFCREKSIEISHNYSEDNTQGSSLFLKCSHCSKCLEEEPIINICDAYYEYSNKIKEYFDEYTTNYNSEEVIRSKIYKKLENVNCIGFLDEPTIYRFDGSKEEDIF